MDGRLLPDRCHQHAPSLRELQLPVGVRVAMERADDTGLVEVGHPSPLVKRPIYDAVRERYQKLWADATASSSVTGSTSTGTALRFTTVAGTLPNRKRA